MQPGDIVNFNDFHRKNLRAPENEDCYFASTIVYGLVSILVLTCSSVVDMRRSTFYGLVDGRVLRFVYEID